MHPLEQIFNKRRACGVKARVDLMPECVCPHLRASRRTRRSGGRDDYAAELVKVHAARPDVRVLVAFKWTDKDTGQACNRAGIQLYRIEDGSWARPGSASCLWVRPSRMPRSRIGQSESSRDFEPPRASTAHSIQAAAMTELAQQP